MRLWIRADASETMGLGHITRTLAIAEEASGRGWDVRFVTSSGSFLAADKIDAAGFPYTGLDGEANYGWVDEVAQGDGVLFDGYHLGLDDVQAVRDRGALTIAVDDLGGRFEVDILVNPNEDDAGMYDVAPHTHLCLGPSFALVGREYRQKRRVRIPRTQNVVVSAGSSDSANITMRVIATLRERRQFEHADVIAGPGLTGWAANLPEWASPHFAPKQPWTVFDGGDAAIAAAGVTTWELLCMGLPGIFVKVADNQAGIVRSVSAHDAGIIIDDLGPGFEEELRRALAALAQPSTQQRLMERGKWLIDGQGPARVVDVIMESRA